MEARNKWQIQRILIKGEKTEELITLEQAIELAKDLRLAIKQYRMLESVPKITKEEHSSTMNQLADF